MHTPDKIAAGARISAETGADVIKTFYTGDPESMRRVVDYAMVPVVILGGAKKGNLRELYKDVYDAVILAGCAGVAIGNNIWRDPDPAGHHPRPRRDHPRRQVRRRGARARRPARRDAEGGAPMAINVETAADPRWSLISRDPYRLLIGGRLVPARGRRGLPVDQPAG